MMKRVLEPELMQDEEQVVAYAEADFSEPHNHFIELFREKFDNSAVDGFVLDMGCGPGDISFLFAKAFPDCVVQGVDGSACMLDHAKQRLLRSADLRGRLEFLLGLFPNVDLPRTNYTTLISNSLLHHLPDPQILWTTVKRWAAPGARVFIMDLMRPESAAVAQDYVIRYAAGEPEILQRDFFNSLLAAFTVDEVQAQLTAAGLKTLFVEAVSDRHLIVSARMACVG